ncbi:MAG: hypothetical protein Q8Q35_03050 [Nanoarchaeota archaeon]|nr:hypothetical protein [Nanoarchaeota archaeon]
MGKALLIGALTLGGLGVYGAAKSNLCDVVSDSITDIKNINSPAHQFDRLTLETTPTIKLNKNTRDDAYRTLTQVRENLDDSFNDGNGGYLCALGAAPFAALGLYGLLGLRKKD